jgi:hypothetical protein
MHWFMRQELEVKGGENVTAAELPERVAGWLERAINKFLPYN